VNVPPQSPGIRVIFSYEETADDVIKRLVDDAPNVRSLVIITDDKAIRYYSRAAGAGIKSVKDFFGSIKAKASGPGTTDRKTISQSQEYGITQEMEQIWLRKKKDNKDRD
jgi:predicted RNA-binding protein with PIN domain